MRSSGRSLGLALVASVAVAGWAAATVSGLAPPALAQISTTASTARPTTTVIPTTTDPPPSTTPTTKPTTTTTERSTTTKAPATTAAPRSTTTAKDERAPTTARPTIPGPGDDGSGPPATFAQRGPHSGSMSPVLTWLSALGLLGGLGMLAGQWFLTRPGRDGWTL